MEQEQAAFISAVHLKGYKSIRDVAVDLKQGLNIIIGANGSGKTNFLEFLDAVYRSDYKRFINGKKIEVDIKSQPYSVNIKGERVFQSEVKGASYRVEETVSNGVYNNREILFLNEEKKIVRKEGNGQAYPDRKSVV